MNQIIRSPTKPAVKMNRMQRRQAVRKARKVESKANGRNRTAKEPDRAIARDLERAHELHLAEDFAAASEHYQRVLAQQPHNHNALLFLGLLGHQVGDDKSAVNLISRALRINPDNPLALYNLANALGVLGKLDEALNACRRALEIDPCCADAYTALGVILQSMGEFDEARTAYEQAIAVKPTFPAPYKNLAHGRRVTRDDGLIRRIQGVLSGNTPSDRDRSVFNFALGKCFNDIQDYDAAFSHYEVANELSGKSKGFDLATLTDEFDSLIATFTPEFFETQGSPGSDSERPVFILGMPRSGTTLVEQIIASHPLVFGAGELMTINRIATNLPEAMSSGTPYPECVTLMDEKFLVEAANGYLEDLEQISAGAARVTDKMPNNFRHIGLIARLFPCARIIHCQRDPMDTCLSAYFLDFRGRLNFAYDLTHLGQYYRQYERLMAHWKKVSPIAILDVRYEDLVADSEEISRQMIDHCGLEWDDACLAHNETERAVSTASHWQVRQPIYGTSVERWRRYERHLEPLKQALAGTDVSPQGPAAAGDATLDMEAANRFHRAGDLQRATHLYRQVLRRQPDNANALHLLGLAAYEAGDSDTAVRSIGRAIAVKPDFLNAHYNLGTVLTDRGDFEEAAASFKRTLEINPDHGAALGNLGIVLIHQGRLAEAITHLRRATELAPNDPTAHNSLGIALQGHGEDAEAQGFLQRAITLKPDYAEAHKNLGVTLRITGDLDAAREAFENALSIHPNFAEAHLSVGQLLFNDSDPEPAAEAFSKALRADPNLASASFYLGTIRERQGDQASADRHFANLTRCPEVSDPLMDSWGYIRGAMRPSTRFLAHTRETLGYGLERAELDGMILEFGVRNGNTINFIAQHSDRVVHGFDSFQGLPEAWMDKEAGAYTTHGELPEVPTNARLHVGWFDETLPRFLAETGGPIRFMNVDCDIYSSTKTIFDALAERIVPGTIIVFDEYLINSTWRQDEFKAFQEAVENNSWNYEYLAFNLFSKQAAVRIL